MIHALRYWKKFQDCVYGFRVWLHDLTDPCEGCGTRMRARSLWVNPWRTSNRAASDLVWHCRRCHAADRAWAASMRERRAARAGR